MTERKTEPQAGASRGMAPESLRKHNLSTVLQHLHLSGPATRSELTAVTGLNRSTIGDLVGQLTSLELVRERLDSVPSGPGRPSPIVGVRPEGIAVLAVEIAVDSVAVATVGLGGHIFNNVRVVRPRGRFSAEETAQDVAKLAGPLLDSLPDQSRYFAGVGVAVAGLVRRSDGNVRLSPNLGWLDVPFAELLAAELGISGPILVGNEADLGAVAEHRRGARPGTNNLIYVSGEVGVGTGIILNGKLLRGTEGYGGEAGHMMVNPGGLRCRCGGRGCWETEAGEGALLRHVGAEDAPRPSEAIDEILRRAQAGDQNSLGAIAEVGHWLGLGIGNLINLFNPEVVVVGGLFHKLYPFLEAATLEGIEAQALAAPSENVVVVPSRLGVETHLVGAAEMALLDVLADPVSVEDLAQSRTIRSTG